jgi:hypothetical protein
LIATQGPARALVSLALLGGVWFAPLQVSTIMRTVATQPFALCRYAECMAWLRAIDAKVKAQLKLPSSFLDEIGNATVDVYPSDICLATANGLNWKPRFALQSYAAYPPSLDGRCARDYRGEGAPQYILYSHKAIDLEHPCVVDSQTWIEIYRWYDGSSKRAICCS